MIRANREVLARRFPALLAWLEAAPPRAVELRDGPHPALAIDGIQLASRFDPRGEAELQSRLVPADSKRATLYGFAQGELARLLLARAELERLRVVVLDPSVARASFEHCDQCDWLADPRVVLVRGGEPDELELPFAASPGCLRLAADEAARLRDLVLLELATPHIRRRLRGHGAELAARSAENEQRFGGDGDVARLFGTRAGAAIRVAAAGPTLARHYERLRARERFLIAVDAALRPLVAERVTPDVVVTQDAHRLGMERVFDVDPELLRATTLVWFPATPAAVLERWPGPRLAARGALFGSGSVVHPAIDLAVRMGAAEVELLGCDFSLCGGRSHVEGAAWSRTLDVGARPWVLDGHGRRVPSLPNLIGYLRDLERYIARHPRVRFVNASRDGAAIRGTACEEARDAA